MPNAASAVAIGLVSVPSAAGGRRKLSPLARSPPVTAHSGFVCSTISVIIVTIVNVTTNTVATNWISPYRPTNSSTDVAIASIVAQRYTSFGSLSSAVSEVNEVIFCCNSFIATLSALCA